VTVHARSGAFQLDPDKLDEAIKQFESEQLPRYRKQSGYKGFSLMVNRESGKVIGISYWGSDEQLHASDDLGSEAREGIQQAGGGQGDIVREEYEVILDERGLTEQT
jgi:hypothetical protein